MYYKIDKCIRITEFIFDLCPQRAARFNIDMRGFLIKINNIDGLFILLNLALLCQ